MTVYDTLLCGHWCIPRLWHRTCRIVRASTAPLTFLVRHLPAGYRSCGYPVPDDQHSDSLPASVPFSFPPCVDRSDWIGVDRGGKRRFLSLEDKLKLIQEVASGRKKSKVAAEYKMPMSTLSTILQKKNHILNAVGSGVLMQRRSTRRTPYEKIERALLSWMTEARVSGEALTGPIIQQKAVDIAATMGFDNFTASTGWLQRFKQRHNMIFKPRRPEARAPALKQDDTMQQNIVDVIQQYKAADIFSATEMGLFFQLLPEEANALKGSTCDGGKQGQVRLTVLLCANMDGTEKLTPVVIGKNKSSGSVRGMPVQYVEDDGAWMTRTIFQTWLKELDDEIGKQQRKICLFVDECSAHRCSSRRLQNIKLKFFPADSTPVRQPLDQEFMRSLKRAYRQRQLQKLVFNLRLDRETKIDMSAALKMLSAVWETTKQETIANHFKNAGFLLSADGEECPQTVVCEKNDCLLALWRAVRDCGAVPEGVELDDFLGADAAVVTRHELTEREILGDVSSSEDEDEEPKSWEPDPAVADWAPSNGLGCVIEEPTDKLHGLVDEHPFDERQGQVFEESASEQWDYIIEEPVEAGWGFLCEEPLDDGWDTVTGKATGKRKICGAEEWEYMVVKPLNGEEEVREAERSRKSKSPGAERWDCTVVDPVGEGSGLATKRQTDKNTAGKVPKSKGRSCTLQDQTYRRQILTAEEPTPSHALDAIDLLRRFAGCREGLMDAMDVIAKLERTVYDAYS